MSCDITYFLSYFSGQNFEHSFDSSHEKIQDKKCSSFKESFLKISKYVNTDEIK